jgi:hypothetical protein
VGGFGYLDLARRTHIDALELGAGTGTGTADEITCGAVWTDRITPA